MAKAPTQGLGSKVKNALETTLQLAPKHADAHVALGTLHAEVIDKVGSLLGKTRGASKSTGLVMLDGDRKLKDAEKLYADAAACTPADATERLDVEMAKAELED